MGSVTCSFRLLVIFLGAFQKVGLVWDFSDTMNGAMAIPNLIGLIGLSGVLAKASREQKEKARLEV